MNSTMMMVEVGVVVVFLVVRSTITHCVKWVIYKEGALLQALLHQSTDASNTAQKWSFPLSISLVNATKSSFLCSHLLKKSLMENFVFCALRAFSKTKSWEVLWKLITAMATYRFYQKQIKTKTWKKYSHNFNPYPTRNILPRTLTSHNVEVKVKLF